MGQSETYFNKHDEQPEGAEDDLEALPVFRMPDKPRTEAAATMILRRALVEASEDIDAAGLWDIFRAHAMRHEYCLFIDSIIAEHRAELSAAVFEEHRPELMEKAVASLRVEAVRAEVTRKLEAELVPAIRASVRQRLEAVVEPAIRQEVAVRLRHEMQKQVEEMLRAELMHDPQFIETAKQELQRKLLGL